MGSVWEGLGEGFGASWGVLGPPLSMLAFGLVFKSAFGGIWVGFLHDFEGFGADFGRKDSSMNLLWGVVKRKIHTRSLRFWLDLGWELGTTTRKIQSKEKKGTGKKTNKL